METGGLQALRSRIEGAFNDIGAEDVGAEWIRVAEEVGEGDGGEGVVVCIVLGEELDHGHFGVAWIGKVSCSCIEGWLW
jgi:hypothetical protein